MLFTLNWFSCLVSPSAPARPYWLLRLPFRHHFLLSSVDHSTADAMKPSISKGYHLGSVNSSLVNPYLTPPLPLSQLCHPLCSSVSMAVYIHQGSAIEPSSYLSPCTNERVHKDMGYRFNIWLKAFFCLFKNTLFFTYSWSAGGLHLIMTVGTSLQLVSQHLLHFKAVGKPVSCLCSKGCVH